jgi:asparagine synthase (glutamine-hydrolysing)
VNIEEVYSEAIECWDSCGKTGLIDKTLQFYTRLYLQNDILAKIDRAGMMNSLEVRAPYLDIELVDFVRRIPADYKYRNGTTKYILKKALKPLLPAKILRRAKKGFGAPIGGWFKTGFLEVGEGACSALLRPGFIRKRVEEHVKNAADHRGFLWNAWLLNRHVNGNAGG